MRRVASVLPLLPAFFAASCYQVAGYDDFEFFEPVRSRIEISGVDKLDLLLVVDNTRGQKDKQEALEQTLDVLLRELVAPSCRDANGDPAPEQDEGEPCPGGYARRTRPLVDLHVGVITSSLGSHGGDACPEDDPMDRSNDRAHLQRGEAATYADMGFLAWDPLRAHDPPGEGDIDAFIDDLGSIIDGTGEGGCGYEAQLEAWYRFLVEPDPHDRIEIANDEAILVGTDAQVLAERAAFLRPDSLVVIAVLSDENDCSIRDGGFFYHAALIKQPNASPYHLPKPRAACASDPNDACCLSCAQPPGPGCDTAADDCDTPVEPLDDNINVRCFDQKRRFGIDFKWPIDRYVAGLTSPQVTDRHGNVVANPLVAGREPGRVVFTAIVGVPWQDLARRGAETGLPDLVDGLDGAGQPVGGFQNGVELVANGTWDLILGDPSQYPSAWPTDTLMIESHAVRPAKPHPITGDAPAPPDSDYGANPINGHEYNIPERDDLQFACVYALPEARECEEQTPSCECGFDTENENPICQDPGSGEYSNTQFRGKAYPGIRHLELARALGAQAAVVGSACVQQITDPDAADFGYAAAFQGAVGDRLATELRGQICIDKPLRLVNGTSPCVLIEALHAEPSCACNAPARRFPDISRDAAVQLAKADPAAAAEGWDCFCEVNQLPLGYEADACRSYPLEPVVTTVGAKVDGWCYLDPEAPPPTDDVCPPHRPYAIRAVGDAQPREGAAIFLYCE
jgi:hypothetical protein